MNLLFIGDIFGSAGRGIVSELFASILRDHAIDLAIANCENSAGGFGVTPQIADDLFHLGIDVLTGGNHIWDKRDIYDYMGRTPRLLRPANYPGGLPGRGVCIAEARNGAAVAVLNLQGRTYMTPIDCPFRTADSLLAELPATVKVRFVDFHAEVTSEKVAMGWYLDGRVSAVVGTHTHIPTADARVLAGGTAYQTDCGMTGPYDSVIGVEKQIVLQKFLTGQPVRMEAARTGVELHAVIVTVDPATGRATAIRRLALTHGGVSVSH
ncbi:MAG: TIGR00282 family metallophosphoesterase [Bryobacterales bacterium]|nr:TIGR00282 family metallophosphoesterase [Bryobacterales bacterium]